MSGSSDTDTDAKLGIIATLDDGVLGRLSSASLLKSVKEPALYSLPSKLGVELISELDALELALGQACTGTLGNILFVGVLGTGPVIGLVVGEGMYEIGT